MRDAALIAVVGIGLGLTYNHAMLLAHDDRALTWVAKERTTGVLDLASPAAAGDATTPAPGSAPATPAVSGTQAAPTASAAANPAPATTASATKPAAHDTTHAKRSSARKGATAKTAPAGSSPAPAAASAPASAAPANAAPASGGPANPPATSTGAATGVAAANVPAIPDTREPLEANYTVIKALHDADAALFVDARSADEYAAGHIPGAISMPFDDVFKKPDLAKNLDSQGRPIVTYCDGGDCELSKDLAFSLIDNGHKKVVFFKDGLPGWKSAGNPVHTGSQP